MQYQVLVQKPSERHFVASILGISGIVADGNTEEEVIAKIKTALKSQLATAKIVTIDIDSESPQAETDPWIKHAGIFADDPTFDNFLEEVAAFRRQIDEETTL